MFIFLCRDIVNTNTSNDSDKSDKTLVDVSIITFKHRYIAPSSLFLYFLNCNFCHFILQSGSTDRTALLDRVDSTESADDPERQGWQRVNSVSVYVMFIYSVIRPLLHWSCFLKRFHAITESNLTLTYFCNVKSMRRTHFNAYESHLNVRNCSKKRDTPKSVK